MAVIGKPKPCKNLCDMTIAWYRDDATGAEYFTEMDANGAPTGYMHKCPNYCRPQSTTTSTSTRTATEAEAALKPSNANGNTVEQTVVQILQIVQKIERIVSDTITPQS